MNIRKARKEDVPDIIALINFIFHEFQVHNPDASTRQNIAEIPNFYHKGNGEFWVAEENGKIVGGIGVSEVPFKKEYAGFVQRLAIYPEFRKQKLGSLLYKTVEEFAKEKWKYLVLGVDNPSYEGALYFYKKQGYTEVPQKEIPQILLNDNDQFYFQKKI